LVREQLSDDVGVDVDLVVVHLHARSVDGSPALSTSGAAATRGHACQPLQGILRWTFAGGGPVAELTVIKWRDIPMQIVVRDDSGGSARRLLPDRFQEAVDAAAMVAGLIGSDDYTEQMMMDRSQVGEDLEAEATAAEQAVLNEWSEDQLKVAIRAGGYQGGEDVAGSGDAVRPSQD
jgi:hypothetical protein